MEEKKGKLYDLSHDLIMPESDEDPVPEPYEKETNVFDVMGQEKSPLSQLVDLLLIDAVRKDASHIHIELYENDFRVRYRIDGTLTEVMKPPQTFHSSIVELLKTMAGLKVEQEPVSEQGGLLKTVFGSRSERPASLPQYAPKGRFRLRVGPKRVVAYRMHTIGTQFGEHVVLRLEPEEQASMPLAALGFDTVTTKRINDALALEHGLLLFSGPMGSGVTTTAYASLERVDRDRRAVMTAEVDPLRRLHGANQAVTQPHNYPSTIRALLDHDPEVLLIGGLPNPNTVSAAIQAALAGCQVLAVLRYLHGAPETIVRLQQMGASAPELSSALNLVLSQRLLRRICEHCGAPDPQPPEVLEALGVPKDRLEGLTPQKGVGCEQCADSGFAGRIAVGESLVIDPELERVLNEPMSAHALRDTAKQHGLKSLRDTAIDQMFLGLISLDEVQRTPFI